jgi:predicted AAA+ superfamily ATPase
MLKLTNLGVDYRTAEKYVGILEYSYIIALLEPFHTNEKTSLRKTKFFFEILAYYSWGGG